MKVDLSKPILGMDGQQVTSLEVKEISVDMYFRHGEMYRSEVRTNGNTETVFIKPDVEALKGYISDCTGLSGPELSLLDPKDFTAVKQAVQDFFQPYQ